MAILTILWKVLRFVPRTIALLFALSLIFTSLSDSIREGDPKLFFIGVGDLISGADREIYDGMEKLKAGTVGWEIYFGVLGGILVLFYLLKIFSWFFASIIPFASEVRWVPWLIAIIIVFLLQTTINSAATGQITPGFSGLVNFLLNLSAFFGPVGSIITSWGNYSIRHPIL